MKANNSLRINMPRALELISFFFLGHGPTYPISDLSGSAIMRGNCIGSNDEAWSEDSVPEDSQRKL